MVDSGDIETIMMSVDKPDALQAVEIHALRQLADAVTSQSKQFAISMEAQAKAMDAHGRAMERLTGRLEEVRDKVIRLEEQRHGADIKELRLKLDEACARVNALESDRDQVKGAAALWSWLSKNMPWLLPFLAATGVILVDRIKKP